MDIGRLPAGHRPPEETKRRLLGMMMTLNPILHMVKEQMYAEVNARRMYAKGPITHDAETYAEVQMAEELCEQIGKLARRMLREANWRPGVRGRGTSERPA